MHKYNQEQTRI